MELVLIIALAISIGVSFLCSLAEASLYAVSMAYVTHKAESGHRASQILFGFKKSIGRPIAAILILNTIAHTAGASVAGWAVGEIYGAEALLPFSILYTLAVLYLSEILPKLIGVTYAKTVATILAYPLYFSITVLKPLIVLSDFLAKMLKKGEGSHVSEEELLAMASMGKEEGIINPLEQDVIANVIGLDQLRVMDVMTPRVVVVRALASDTVGDVVEKMKDWGYSRIPVLASAGSDALQSYVTQRDVLWAYIRGEKSITLSEVARPLRAVPETMRCDVLLMELIDQKDHIRSVVDEHGSLVGIITLEDLVEEIVGKEIVDEYDPVENLRAYARLQRLNRFLKRK